MVITNLKRITSPVESQPEKDKTNAGNYQTKQKKLIYIAAFITDYYYYFFKSTSVTLYISLLFVFAISQGAYHRLAVV